MKKRKPKVVIDTNLLVSGLISSQGNPAKLLKTWRKELFSVVTSQQLIQEFEEVLSRANLAKYKLSPLEIRKLVKSLTKSVIQIDPIVRSVIQVIDPKDERVLVCAVSGKANYLVTGDSDLLVLKNNSRLKTLQIVTVDEFLKLVVS